jgi:SET domain-containing protein
MKKNLTLHKGVVVRKSKIDKRGFFAVRDFKKGEMVLKWHPKILTKMEVMKLPERRKHDVDKIGENKYVLQRASERFMNHSCEPNTKVKNLADIAIRNIRKGEEITSDYGKGILTPFRCHCGSKACRKVVK